jgi:trigger factor
MVHAGVQTVEELKKAIREDLTARLEADARTFMERQISEKLLEANTFEVPESMVRLQAIMMLQGMSQRLSAQGVGSRTSILMATRFARNPWHPPISS